MHFAIKLKENSTFSYKLLTRKCYQKIHIFLNKALTFQLDTVFEPFAN